MTYNAECSFAPTEIDISEMEFDILLWVGMKKLVVLSN